MIFYFFNFHDLVEHRFFYLVLMLLLLGEGGSHHHAKSHTHKFSPIVASFLSSKTTVQCTAPFTMQTFHAQQDIRWGCLHDHSLGLYTTKLISHTKCSIVDMTIQDSITCL